MIWYLKISLLGEYLGVLIGDTLLATRTDIVRLLVHSTGSHAA